EIVARGLDRIIGSGSLEHLDGFSDDLWADTIAADDRDSSAMPHARILADLQRSPGPVSSPWCTERPGPARRAPTQTRPRSSARQHRVPGRKDSPWTEAASAARAARSRQLSLRCPGHDRAG